MTRFTRRSTIPVLAALAALALSLSVAAGTDDKAAAAAPKKARLRPALKYGMIADGETIEQKLALAKSLGFEGVEVCLLYTSPSPRDS